MTLSVCRIDCVEHSVGLYQYDMHPQLLYFTDRPAFHPTAKNRSVAFVRSKVIVLSCVDELFLYI